MPSSTTCPAAFTQPPALQKGDLIGLICPAGYMPLEKTEQCRATLASWGYRTLVGSSVGHQHHYFAGTDDERLADLQAMLDNPDVKAILCARGGYGTSRKKTIHRQNEEACPHFLREANFVTAPNGNNGH